MEQLVLGLFQEHLSKIIVGFRKEQVNANLLNGKGEITDVSLNCSVLNEPISKVIPFIAFEEIHVSKLGFHVTSWSNIRKAPIVVDIGCITVSIQEPLTCVPEDQRKRILMITEKEMLQLLLKGVFKGRSGSYGFGDRIVDNLTIEIEKVEINFRTCGKFKTHRIGPWTPPQLQIELSNLKVVSVDQHGNEGDPEQVWAHNRYERQEFLLFKKMTMETSIKVVSNGKEQTSATLVQAMPLAIQSAVKRRLRDGAILALQSDVTIPSVEVQVRPDWIPLLSHLLAGLQYAFAKDRLFEDPLKHESKQTPISEDEKISLLERTLSKDDSENEEELEDGDEDDDEDGAAEDDNNAYPISEESIHGDDNDTFDEPKMKQGSSHGPNVPRAPYRARPIILLPNGMAIYENLTVTCSVHRMTVRGTYSDDPEGFVQLTARGIISELIWPKVNNEFGLHAQSSISFLSLQEKEQSGKQMKHILIGGISHNDHPPLDKATSKPKEIGIDENFPMFERRSIRDDPVELRHSFPSQAIGLKSTVDFPKGETVKVLHELGLDEFDLILDSESWCRVLAFVSANDSDAFDSRWHSGDWTGDITMDMLCEPANFALDTHIQNTKQLFLDENSLISSDDFNVTARITNIEMRIPAAVQEDIRACDILVELKESTIIVSSALPRTFLSGKIGNSISGDESIGKGDIDFPNDPNDTCYSLERTEDPSLRQQGIATHRNVSTFRFKFTVIGFQTRIVPVIPFCNGMKPQQLMSPTDLTMIVCFEGEPPVEPGSSSLKIRLFISIQINKLHFNVDFDLLAGATSTLVFHFAVVKDIVNAELKRLSSHATEVATAVSEENQSKIKKSLHGRRVLVRRHLSKSRDAGGLGVVFCLQQAEFGLTIWRQNVPLTSPLRHGDNSRWPDAETLDHHITLLKLFDVHLTELEFGVEFDFRSLRSRRIIFKSCIEQGTVKVCDFAAALMAQQRDDANRGDSTGSPNLDTPMVDILSFGLRALPNDLISSYPGPVQHFALRLEEQMKSSRSWSLAADLTSPAMINLHVAAFNETILLLIEALLLPTSSKRSEELLFTGSVFPDRSVGAIFERVFSDVAATLSNSSPTEEDSGAVLPDADSEIDSFVERALRVVFKRFLPSDLRLVLLRLELSNVLLCIPSESEGLSETSKSLGLLLNKSDVMVRFVPFADALPTDMENVLACKGIAWSDLIKAEGTGYFQGIYSKQSLIAKMDGDDATEREILVPPFDISMTYEAANFSLSMNDKLMVNDIRKIENFFAEMELLAGRCQTYNAELLSLCKVMQKPPTDSVSIELPIHNGAGNHANIKSMVGQERNDYARNLLRRLHHELSHFENDLRQVIRMKDQEIERLKVQVFRKEKERFAALALVSSRISGWIRMGGLHQTGQRVARKSTMWPHWAVLRKNLLLLYSGPGEVKPVDVVFLPGGKLRELAGGSSRQDVKRGFAFIENSGTTRYFIAGSAKEYSLWIREIIDVLERSNAPSRPFEFLPPDSTLGGDSGSQKIDSSTPIAANGMHEEDSRIVGNDRSDQGRISRIGLGNRLAATKTKLGSAIQTARSRGKDASDHSGSFHPEGELSSHGDTQPFFEDENETTDDPSIGTSRRRLQFGRKQQPNSDRVGLSSRIGSALQSARQNRKDNTERQPGALAGLRGKFRGNRSEDQTQDAHLSLDPLPSQGGNYQWTCVVCTFINNIENFPIYQTTCDMCGGDRQLEDQKDNNPASSEDANSLDQGNHKVDNTQVSDLLGLPLPESEVADKFGSSEPESSRSDQAEALLGSQALESSRSEQAEAQDLLGSQEPESSLRGRFSGLGTPTGSKRAVTPTGDRRSGRFSFMKRGRSGDEETFFDGGAVTLKSVHAGTRPPKKGDGFLKSAPMKMFKNRWIVSIECSSLASAGAEIGRDVDKSFLVRCSKANQTSPDKGIEKNCSIGDLLYLHSQVSSGIEPVLQKLIDDSSDENMGKTRIQVETIVAIGRILDGMLDLEENGMVEKTQSYLVLGCPLPIETLASISEIVGIDSSTMDITLNGDDQESSDQSNAASRIDSPTELKMERSEAILSLIQTCETELLRTQSNTVEVAPVQAIGKAEPVVTSTSREELHLTKSWIHEPLLPQSVTDRFQNAMHEALTNVMLERDEAHAHLISANVLHIHELEQEKRKNDRLKIGKQVSESVARFKQPNVANLFAKFDPKFDDGKQKQLEAKIEGFERLVKDSGDEALVEITKQLASEVAEKTANALEVTRLKQALELVKANNKSETDALKEELRRMKELVSTEERDRETAIRESAHWKSLYESLAKSSGEAKAATVEYHTKVVKDKS